MQTFRRAGATLAFALLLLAAGASPVAAHNGAIVFTCDDGASVALRHYSTGVDNHVVITLDGAKVIDQHFGASFDWSQGDLDPFTEHELLTSVYAGDDPQGERGWTFDSKRQLGVCEEPTPTPSPTPTAMPEPTPTPSGTPNVTPPPTHGPRPTPHITAPPTDTASAETDDEISGGLLVLIVVTSFGVSFMVTFTILSALLRARSGR